MALGDMLSGIFGGNAGKSEMKKALKLQEEAANQLKNIYVPTVAEQEILLQNPELAGLLDPSLLQGTAMEEVSVDPRMRQAQMRALEELSGLSQQGLGAEDRAAFNQLQRESQAQAAAQQSQVLQNAAQRGMADSGSTMMAQLMAGQQAANRSQQGGEALAAQAAAARRQALGQFGDMSNTLAGQDLAQKSQVASAKDNINQFNAQAKTGADQFNLQNKQNIANQRASNANQQEIYNKQLIQQKFGNDMSKATGVVGQQNQVANTLAQQGQAAAQGQAQMTGALLGGAASLGASYLGKK